MSEGTTPAGKKANDFLHFFRDEVTNIHTSTEDSANQPIDVTTSRSGTHEHTFYTVAMFRGGSVPYYSRVTYEVACSGPYSNLSSEGGN